MVRGICQSACFMLLVAFLVACQPSGNPDTLPTLARLPSETSSPPPPVEIARNTLPATFTPTYTATASPTWTPSPTVSGTPTVSVTPSPTITYTPSPTATPLPTIAPEERPLAGLLEVAMRATLLPTDYYVPPFAGITVTPIPNAGGVILSGPGIPTPLQPLEGLPPATQASIVNCSTIALGGFSAAYMNRDTATQIGCPTTSTVQTLPAAWQDFERGTMVWLGSEILVFYNTGGYSRYNDTYTQGVDPETSAESPPSGYIAPVRGFLKVWSSDLNVRTALGWGVTGEQGATGYAQTFANGRMIYVTGRSSIFVLVGGSSGAWSGFVGTYE